MTEKEERIAELAREVFNCLREVNDIGGMASRANQSQVVEDILLQQANRIAEVLDPLNELMELTQPKPKHTIEYR